MSNLLLLDICGFFICVIIIYLVLINLVTHKARAKHEPLVQRTGHRGVRDKITRCCLPLKVIKFISPIKINYVTLLPKSDLDVAQGLSLSLKYEFGVNICLELERGGGGNYKYYFKNF